ncbi:MAG TPA: hypothetical protein VGL66_19185 [Caulobacteraceae bacterium]
MDKNRPLPHVAAAGLLAAILAALAATVVSVIAPLAVYSLTLAAFGLPHVLSELRYVDRRFGRSLGLKTVVVMAALLAAIVAARAAGLLHLLRPEIEAPMELGLVACLALTAARGGTAAKGAAIVVGLAIGVLAMVDPFETTIGFAVLHNLTPLGFLWQLAPRRQRPLVMGWASAAFIGLPLLVASGAPRRLLAAAGVGGAPLDPLSAGPIAWHLPVYVPYHLLSSASAIDLFTGSVVAQQAHYAAVIVVLPLLLSRWSPGAKGLVPWPRGLVFYAVAALLAVVAFSGFAISFVGARALYSLLAAIHAWIEIPILITALTAAQPVNRSPAPNEALLAASERSMA